MVRETLHFIAQKGWAGHSLDYLSAMVAFLCENIGADYAFVARLQGEPATSSRTLALHRRGHGPQQNFTYLLQDTPCANVADGNLCCYASGVQRLFPKDELLIQMGIEAYMGRPLWDSRGRDVGLIVLLHTRPFDDAPTLEAALQVLAVGASSSLERERSEEKARQMRQSFDLAGVGIAHMRPDGTFRMANRMFQNMTGYSPEEIAQINFFQLTAPQHRHLDDFLRSQSLLDPGQLSDLEKICIDKNGRKFWARQAITAHNDADGQNDFLILVLEDITRRKEAERELISMNEELLAAEEEIRATNEELLNGNQSLRDNLLELRDAKKAAEESDRLKTAFLANLSHEVRTPMNGILGFAELLRRDDLSPRDKQRYVELLSVSTQQLLQIIMDIVDISKLEAGALLLNNTEFNLNELLRQQADWARAEVASKKKPLRVELESALPDSLALVVNDNERLAQCVRNLLSNAIKFTPQGVVSMGYTLHRENLRFHVRDTGIGIRPQDLGLVFERFRQAEESNTRRFGGMGLGLTIVRGIVQLMEGRVWAESEPDMGSTFFFEIPMRSAIGQQAWSALEARKPKVDGLCVLVVEDEEVNFAFIDEVLRASGVLVSRASDGLQAVRMATQDQPPPDLVLMDLQLPLLDGLQATRKILALRPGLPIIAQTAFSMSGDPQRCFEAGCSDYIAKPLNKNLLISKIANALNR